MRASRKRLVSVILVLATVGVLPVVHAARTKVVYQYNWYGETIVDNVYLALVEEFQKENPTVEVELIRGSSSGDKLIAAIAGGNPPDLVHFERSIIIEWANKGLLQPIDNLTNQPLKRMWLPGSLSEVQLEGRLYGIPWDTDIRGLYWNKDLVAQGGFNESRAPATMAELDEMARKLTTRDAEGRYTQLGFIPWVADNWYAVGWLYTFGGALFDPATKQPVVNTPNHIRGFEWLQSYGERFPNAAVASTGDPFIAGHIALVAHESGHVGRIAAGNPGLNYGVGEVPHPEYGHNGTWLGGTAFVIPLGARNVEGASILLNWMSRKETHASWWRQTTRLPTRTDSIALIRNELPPPQAILLRQADVAFGRPPLWYPAIYNNTRNAMLDVVHLRQGPKAALDEAQRLLEIEFAAVFGK
jgi:multiple sugar transport system substrate-binding protein